MRKSYYNVYIAESEEGINWRTLIGMVEISLENFLERDPSIKKLDTSQNVYLSNSEGNRKLEDDMFILKDENGKIHLLTRIMGERGREILKDIHRQFMQKIRLDIP